MSNGTVISRVGSAAVALMSETAGRPVLICCETYKFAERVQLDSITANELGNPEALVKGGPSRIASSPLSAWTDLPHLGEASTRAHIHWQSACFGVHRQQVMDRCQCKVGLCIAAMDTP